MSCLLCRPPHFQGTRLAVSRGLCVEEPSREAIGQALGQGKDDRQGLQQMCLKQAAVSNALSAVMRDPGGCK